MSKIPFGPTYDEMLNPSHQDPEVRAKALKAIKENELDPINLFNITWKNEKNEVNKIVLPKGLTGWMLQRTGPSTRLKMVISS